MLSKTLGSLMQITISDTKAYLFVENVIDNGATVGEAIGDNEKFFIETPELYQLPFVVNYKSLSNNIKKLRSSTYFFKDENGIVEYILTITTSVDEFIYIRNILDIFTNGSAVSDITTNAVDHIPKLNMSMHYLIDDVIDEGQKKYGTTVNRMTKMEKEGLIREMQSRGTFLVKGTIPEVATKLSYSETSIYRYLQTLEKK